MARSRNIKPGFFLNETLAELGPHSQILFAGLWCIADREGRLEDRPKKIKIQTLPYYDDIGIESLLDGLHAAKFIKRYVLGSNKYIQINNFNKHQNPHKNEKVSDILPCESLVNHEMKDKSTKPLPDKHNSCTVQTQDKTSSNPADSFNLIPDSLYIEEFEKIWAIYPKRPNNPRKLALKAYLARRKEQVPHELLLQKTQEYKKYCESIGVIRTQHTMQAVVFFGPNERYNDDFVVENKSKKPRTNTEWIQYGESKGIGAKPGETENAAVARIKRELDVLQTSPQP